MAYLASTLPRQCYCTISNAWYVGVGISSLALEIGTIAGGAGGRRDFWQSGGSRGELMQGTNELL